MTDIDPLRRQELLAKFPAINNPRPMDPRANTQVRATLRAEQIIKRVWQNLAAADVVLFDHAHVPALAARADVAAADFHRRRRRGQLHYDTHDSDFDPDATHEHGACGYGELAVKTFSSCVTAGTTRLTEWAPPRNTPLACLAMQLVCTTTTYAIATASATYVAACG